MNWILNYIFIIGRGDGNMRKITHVSRYRILPFALALLISILVSGCNSSIEVNEEHEANITKEAEEAVEVKTTIETEETQDRDTPTQENSNTIKIYISADRTVSKSSGISIEQGVRTALDEIQYKIHGQDIEVVILDHRGSSPRAKQHLDEYLSDDQALVIFSGLHSPPILEHRDFINENEILLLDPWAAAGPITRYPSEQNWIFRLSIDDTKAGHVIVNHLLSEGYEKPYLILEDTGWGRSNHSTMSTALNDVDKQAIGVSWFNWSIGINQAKYILREANETGADSIIFVGNSPEGKVFAKAMSELSEDQRLPIRSHWGITGGDFPEVINAEIRKTIDIEFLQTRFSFLNIEGNQDAIDVLARVKRLYPEQIKTAQDIEAPTGFIHSYDLTKIMISALNQVDENTTVIEKRSQLRKSLEELEQPVQGLLKTYEKPFSTFSENNLDAHEALGQEDLIMAYYGENNEIILDEDH